MDALSRTDIAAKLCLTLYQLKKCMLLAEVMDKVFANHKFCQSGEYKYGLVLECCRST